MFSLLELEKVVNSTIWFCILLLFNWAVCIKTYLMNSTSFLHNLWTLYFNYNSFSVFKHIYPQSKIGQGKERFDDFSNKKNAATNFSKSETVGNHKPNLSFFVLSTKYGDCDLLSIKPIPQKSIQTTLHYWICKSTTKPLSKQLTLIPTAAKRGSPIIQR